MDRPLWLNKIKNAFEEKSVVWLTGVRRSGKTTLTKQFMPKFHYDCELPRIRRMLEDAEDFFSNLPTTIITLDEIHRLENATEVLKIAADHFPNHKVIATGSSTLGASRKFKDALTDRKRTVWLQPVLLDELNDFGKIDFSIRMLHGGLPPFLLAKKFPESSFIDWVESFWAKDIQELFSVDKKYAFLKFFELLALTNGRSFEAQKYSSPCGVSHTTIASYIQILSDTHICHVIRPFSEKKSKEITSMPKVYFFDTGFITYFRGNLQLDEIEKGYYFESLVLNELQYIFHRSEIMYWRDKNKNGIDFIIKKRGSHSIAIECKWQEKEFDPKPLKKFREDYPLGINMLVAFKTTQTKIVKKRYGDLSVIIIPIKELRHFLLQLCADSFY
jgi:predicted AAA+ superfamily ATPase